MGRDSRINPFGRDAIAPPPAEVLDVYGRPLAEGDHLQLCPPVPPLFRVIAIKPCMDPKAPPNLMEIELATSLLFRASRMVPNKEFIRVITAEEALARGARPPDAPAPSPAPQPSAPPAFKMEVVQPLTPPDHGGTADPSLDESKGEPV